MQVRAAAVQMRATLLGARGGGAFVLHAAHADSGAARIESVISCNLTISYIGYTLLPLLP